VPCSRGCWGPGDGGPVRGVVGGAVAFAGSLALAAALVRRPVARLSAENHRGARLPVVLGLGVAAGVTVGSTAAVLLSWGDESRIASMRLIGLAAAAAIVLGAGLGDDLSTGGPRGLRGHARALLRGRPSTGLLKVIAALAGGVIVVVTFPRPGIAGPVGVLTVAACANLWNGLDVVPGRAVKAFAPVALALAVAGPTGVVGSFLAAFVGGALGVAFFDLRERAMLGDAGSNLLGFVVGAGVYLTLPTWALAAVAAIAVGLNVLAETVTLSRIVDAVPLLRWADSIGRRRSPRAEPEPKRARSSPGLQPSDSIESRGD
jgi:UDP-GlcNAc:undecaprenyl-phosphate/decaprenyl-phosphate GlcNAc-1-phosphate transferase